MNINAAFPGAFLKAADLQGKRVKVVIDRVALEEVGGDHKPVMYFANKERGLVLNKTNSNIIAEMYGPETDDWHGQPIVIYPARVEFQGKIVDAIRVLLESGTSADESTAAQAPAPSQIGRPATPRSAPVPPAAAPSVTKIDDEIPF